MKIRALFMIAVLALTLTAGFAQTTDDTSLTASSSDCSTANSCAIARGLAQNIGGATIKIRGTYSGTLQFEGSTDYQVSWVSVNATPSNSATAASSTTSTGVWQLNTAGYTDLRVRVSSYSSGTAIVQIRVSTASASLLRKRNVTHASFTDKAVNFSVAGVTTLATSTSLNAKVGQAIGVACHFFAGSATIGASDSAGNTFTASPDGQLSVTGVAFEMFSAVVTVPSATDTPSCNYTGSVTYTGIDAILASGVNTASLIDAHTFGTGSAATSFTSSTFNASANDLIIAASAWNQISLTSTAGTNFTLRNNELALGGTGADETWIPPTAQTGVTASMTISSAQNGIIGVLAFKSL